MSNLPQQDTAEQQRYTLIKEDPPFGIGHVGFNYTQNGRKAIKQLRQEFRQIHPEFIKYVAEKYPARLGRVGIDSDEIATMREHGIAPLGFTVRHIIPLAARGSSNDFKNLILIPQQPYAAALGEYTARQLDGMRVDKAGRSRQIKLPLPRNPVFPVPARSVDAITQARFELAAERERQAALRDEVREQQRIEREERLQVQRAQREQRKEAAQAAGSKIGS